MGKKIEDAEVKKECPSCGLGVALDSTICEFCGWDFEEEDEWILQIEKLERELMLEKQRFEPGSVNQKIESTLHTPHAEREKARPAEASGADAGPVPAPKAPAPVRMEPVSKQVKPVGARSQKVIAPAPAPAPKPTPAKPVEVQQVEKAPEPVSEPEPAVRRVKAAPSPEAAQGGAKTRKVRVVRKVKQ